MMRFPSSNAGGANQGTPNVVSAAPQLINRGDDVTVAEEQPTKSSATIEAKAQMRLLHFAVSAFLHHVCGSPNSYRLCFRNLNADVTRFMPMSVRVKRDDGKPRPKADKKETVSMDIPKTVYNKPTNPAPPIVQPSKDDAYMQFMKEMQGLL